MLNEPGRWISNERFRVFRVFLRFTKGQQRIRLNGSELDDANPAIFNPSIFHLRDRRSPALLGLVALNATELNIGLQKHQVVQLEV